MKIIEYIDAKNIIVEFEDGYVVKSEYGVFKKGQIKSAYDKSIYGIGYLGEGRYTENISVRYDKIYKKWRGMLERCYGNKTKINTTYIDCFVCDEWHNYQNFAKWYEENIYQINDEIMELDKDILYKGNKIYNPESCIFVPHNINCLFIKCNTTRGSYPIGVSLHKQADKYIAKCKMNVFDKNKCEYLGLFNTPEEAFEAYKNYKEKIIKKVANKYKDKIPLKLYNALINYQVEITD